MSSLSVGDLAQYNSLSRSGAALNSHLTRLSGELISGQAADTAGHLSGELGPLAGIESSLARLRGHKAVTNEAVLLSDTMQTALGRIADDASELGQVLLSGSTSIAASRVATLGAEAAQKFSAAVAALNSRVGDRSLFSGVETTTAPLPDGADLLDTLAGLTAGATSAADVEGALDTWFADPAGYAAAYQGGDPLAAFAVAPGETAQIDITAVDPAIAETLKGLAMAALLDRGVLAANPDARADLASRAGVVILASQSGLAELTGRLGTQQGRIDEAASRNAAETSALEIARSDLLAIDSYAVASELQQTQAQIETLYTLTSRLSRLSLVNFL